MAIDRIKLRTAINKYFDEDSVFLGYAESTKRNHRRALDILVRVTSSQLNAHELKTEHFDLALRALRDGGTDEENAARKRAGMPPRTGRGPVAVLSDVKVYRAFIRFCHRREYLPASRNPVGHLKVGRGVHVERPIQDMVVQPDETIFTALLDAAGKRHPRDRVVVALGLYAGFRESELKALLVSGVDFDNTLSAKGVKIPAPEVRVFRQKQQAWHAVPMHPVLLKELRRYLTWLEEHHGALQPDWYVVGSRLSGTPILTKTGRYMPGGGALSPMSRLDPTKPAWAVFRDVKLAFESCGHGELYRLGAHTMRRMAGIYITDETGDRRHAKTLLGHSTEATTEGYLRWSDDKDKLRQALAAAYRPEPEPDTRGDSNVIMLRRRGQVA